MSNETQNLPQAVALFDYFTKPQPVSQAHTGYIAQLEHAVLVLTTEVYVLTNAKPYIYDEPTRKAARGLRSKRKCAARSPSASSRTLPFSTATI